MSRDELETAAANTAHHLCWSCRQESGDGPFCRRCIKIQPVGQMGNYFHLFGLAQDFAVNPAGLRQTFYELSRKFHPDFYSGQSETERELARANSAYLNTAFKTLMDPLLRAEYLLALRASGYHPHPSPPADLFEEILEVGDVLEQEELGDDNRAVLAKAGKRFVQRRQDQVASLTDLFARLLAGDESMIEKIEAALNEIRYCRTIIGRIEHRLTERRDDI